MSMALFGVIGVGNMGYPLLKAAIQTFGSNEVIYSDFSEIKRQEVEKATTIPAIQDNITLVKNCKYLLLAIKPQFFPEVLKEIKDHIREDHILISIAAGITIDTIRKELAKEVKVIRAMPNTPAMVNQGMTGICYSNSEFAEEEKETISRFFSSYGRYEVFPETLMNAVVCASGSSPAFVYLFIEALADSAVKYGISRDKAYLMAAQTVLGAATMVLETGEHPGKLKDNVCSPGGATIAGVCALEEYGLRNAVLKASDACYERAEALSKR